MSYRSSVIRKKIAKPSKKIPTWSTFILVLFFFALLSGLWFRRVARERSYAHSRARRYNGQKDRQRHGYWGDCRRLRGVQEIDIIPLRGRFDKHTLMMAVPSCSYRLMLFDWSNDSDVMSRWRKGECPSGSSRWGLIPRNYNTSSRKNYFL